MKEILLSGYSFDAINVLKNEFENSFHENFNVFSSDNSNDLISEIIEKKLFKADEANNKLFMFINFSKEEIQKGLQIYPKHMKRPLFCGLTKHNYSWNVKYLLEHLSEEQQEVKAKLMKLREKIDQSSS